MVEGKRESIRSEKKVAGKYKSKQKNIDQHAGQ